MNDREQLVKEAKDAIEIGDAELRKDIIRRLLSLLPKEGVQPTEIMAVEFGYKLCEQGHNLEKTLSEYEKLMRPK